MRMQWDDSRQWRVTCQATWGVPRAFDLWDFVRQGRSASGGFPVTALGRLCEGLPEQKRVAFAGAVPEDESGVVWYEIEGHSKTGRRSGLRLKIQCRLLVTCQRCLEPMSQDLDEEVWFDVVTEAQIDALESEDVDPDSPEFLVGSRQFDLTGLLEDQLILAVPYVPRHVSCEPKLPADLAVREEEPDQQAKRPNPFEVLGKLKGKH